MAVPTRFRNQQKVAEQKKALFEKLRASFAKKPFAPSAPGESVPVTPTTEASPSAIGASAEPSVVSPPANPLASVRVGSAGLRYSARAEPAKPLALQPWAQELSDVALLASQHSGVHLCLVWPARLESIVPLHAFASLERNMATDLRGLRSILFPGTHNSRVDLQSVVVSRAELIECYRSMWQLQGTTVLKSITPSNSFQAMLSALNDIGIRNPTVPSPSLGELIPAFVFDEPTKSWSTVVTSPLERSIRKVASLPQRKIIRQTINSEWSTPGKAPGALMVVHNSARKEHWKSAITHRDCSGNAKPQLLLFDATSAANNTNNGAVRRIPDYIKLAREHGYEQTGAVVVTDDPKTFFILRARLAEMRLPLSTHVYAAEAEYVLLSPDALPAGWRPEAKSNANFSVAIVDRDASSVALSFQRLASELGNEDTPGHKQLMDACFYILRLSNMPAGYRDLTEMRAQSGLDDFSGRQSVWSTVEQVLRSALAAGSFRAHRSEVEAAIAKTQKLVDNWTDATPMAARLQAAVRKFALDAKHELVVVLPNPRYIELAHHYLRRTMGDAWGLAEPRVEWHTLATIDKNLRSDRHSRHFMFVGVNPSVLRILLSHPDVPNGTSILIAYRQAETTLTTLRQMKELEALKPYRGRIGLLIKELERRLAEVPNPLKIERLGEMSMTFKFEGGAEFDPTTEQRYFKFGLEDGGTAYCSGWVYRYEPDDDPPFRRTAASQVTPGDSVFDMTDALRWKIEAALQINGRGISSVVHPERAFLRIYHQDVQRRCSALFSATKRSVLARLIHARMAELDSSASECRQGRIYYWLDLREDETRPHASKDAKNFRLFCRALEIDDEGALKYWNFIKNARRLNQNLGRALVAQYAEILFQPESAAAYRHIPMDVIKRLQQDALRCVFRVEHVVPPENRKA